MNNLPFELVYEILSYLPLSIIKGRTKKISRFWRLISEIIIEQKLRDCKFVLENLGQYPVEMLGNPKCKLNLKYLSEWINQSDNKVFKAWCLGNFEYPGDSNVITGIELQLQSFDSKSGCLIFVPTGMFTFGIWVNHVGFFPITAPYESNLFCFSAKVEPILRFWFHVEAESAPGADFILHQHNHTDNLSIAAKISRKPGIHEILLRNEFGQDGKLEYHIISEGDQDRERDTTQSYTTADANPVENLISESEQTQNDNFIFQHLDMQERKTIGQVLKVYIPPESILSVGI